MELSRHCGLDPQSPATNRFKTALTIVAIFVVSLFSTACTDEPEKPEKPDDPAKVETVKFSIGSISQLKTEIPKIAAEVVAGKNFIEIELTNNIGVGANDLEVLKSFGDIELDDKKSKINWNSKFIYPTQKGIKITHAEWLHWKEPPIGANPNNDFKFSVSETDRPKFGVYASALELETNEPPDEDLETVNFTIANANELKSKIGEIKATADDSKKFAEVSITGNILITDEHREMLKTLGDAVAAGKAKVIWNERYVAPSATEMKLTFAEWESWGNPPLGKNGNITFLAEANEIELFGEYAALLEVEQNGTDVETVTFTITNAATLASLLAQITQTADDSKKFAKVDITGDIGISEADKANFKALKTLKTSKGANRISVNWGSYGIYPAAKGVTLTPTEWADMNSSDQPDLKIVASPTGDKFEVTQEHLSQFGNYQNMVEVPTPPDPTVNVSISNANELSAKAQEAATAAVSGKEVKVTLSNGLQINSANAAHLEKLLHDNITIAGGTITAASQKVEVTAEILKKIPQYMNGRYNNGNMFFVPGRDKSGGGAEDLIGLNVGMFVTDTASYGKDGIKIMYMVPEKMFWNIHGANASRLAEHKDFPGKIPTDIRADNNLPGGLPAFGNMTDELFWLIETASITPTGAIYTLNVTPVVTTYRLVQGGNQNDALGGVPAAPARIKTLGDAGVTNHSFHFLSSSWDRVKQRGSTNGLNVVPHIQSANADNKIYFEPGRHFIDPDDNNRSNYMPEWFVNRKDNFNFATANNLTIVIEMSKITFRTNTLGAGTNEQLRNAAYVMVGNALQPDINQIELPTLASAKFIFDNTNSRGP